ncbi:integrin alpha, partial [Halobacterium rubrum]
MSLGVVGTTTGATGADVTGDANDTSAASPVQQTPLVSGTNSLTDANTTFAGADANDTFGSALAHGDLNGDGVEDVVVGAPENDSAAGNNSGAVYVFYGPVEEGDIDAESANVTLHGVEAGDRAGYAVAAGDVDDDGTDDLVVGAPLEDTNGQSAGTTYVVDGGSGLPENASLSTADHVLRGEAEGDRAGWSVAAVNRPGGDDVLVGAPGSNASASNAGAAYVVSDADPGVDSLANATAILTGEGEGDSAGWVVAEAGDFDGDGSQDVLVSAPRNNSTAPDAGATYLLTENVTGTVSLADAHLKLRGEAARGRAGWDAAEAGDVNNDSYDDLVVGAPFAETEDSETNAGIAYVVYGGEDDAGTVNLSDAGATLVGSGEDDYAGYSVSSAGSGDVTCDNYADVLVGAPGNNSSAVDAGAVYVVAGSEFPATERNLSTADATLVGEGEGDRAGTAVSDAMDVTGDGDKDVLVGAPLNNSSAVDAGAAYLIAGDCPEPEPEPEPEDVIVTKECVDEQGEVTVTNPNDERVTFTIEGTEYELAANGNSGDSITIDDLDDGDYDWSATTEDGEHVGGGVLTVDCDEPEPENVIVTKDCDNEQGEVTVTNPNDERVTFTIEGDSYTLAADGNSGDSITIDDLDDGDYDWSATTEDGEHVGGGVLTVDCDEPEPEDLIITKECVDEQGEVTITNPNDERVTFTIEGTEYELAANGNSGDSVTLDDLDDGDYDWSATTEDGEHVGGGVLTVDCDEPEPEDVIVTLDCDDEQGELTVVNPNDEHVTFTIEGDSYTLAANGNSGDTLVLDNLNDGNYDWSATTEDGEHVGGGTLTVDCDEPDDVIVDKDCDDEQGEVTITNPNDQKVTFTIEGTEYELAANGNDGDSITLDDLNDGNYDWDAETEDGEHVGGGVLTVDCDEPEPEDLIIKKDCDDEQGGLIVTNPNDERVNFTIDGKTYTLAADGNSGDVVTISDLDDDDYQWNATTVEDNEHIDDGLITVDCDEEEEPDPVTIETKCSGEFDGQLIVVNPNDEPVTFTVGSNSYTLEANGSTDDSEIISFLDDGDYTVETIADGEVIDSQTVEIDCEEPRGPTDTPVVSEDCEQLTLTNPSDSPEAVDFRIRNDSGSSTVDNVAPGESVTIDVSADDYTVDARYVTQDS